PLVGDDRPGRTDFDLRLRGPAAVGLPGTRTAGSVLHLRPDGGGAGDAFRAPALAPAHVRDPGCHATGSCGGRRAAAGSGRCLGAGNPRTGRGDDPLSAPSLTV